jgi:hypothetical protein
MICPFYDLAGSISARDPARHSPVSVLVSADSTDWQVGHRGASARQAPGILSRCAANAEILVVELDEAGRSSTPGERGPDVVRGRQVAERWFLVQEQRQRFSPPLDAPIEF